MVCARVFSTVAKCLAGKGLRIAEQPFGGRTRIFRVPHMGPNSPESGAEISRKDAKTQREEDCQIGTGQLCRLSRKRIRLNAHRKLASENS